MSIVAEIQNTGNIIHLPPNMIFDPDKGLGVYLWEAFVKYGDNIAQIDSETGAQETYKEYFKRIISLAQALQNKGIKKNDLIAYCCSNNMDYVAIMIAAIFIGVKFSAFDNMSDPKDIAHCIDLVKPKIIFCDEPAETLIESAIIEAEVKCDIVVFTKSEKYISMTDFIEKYKTDEEFRVDKTTKIKDTCCILFTSGTSGKVKGAKVTGYGLYYGAITADRSVPDVKTSMVFTLPSWISNISFVMLCLVQGITRIIYKSFNKDNLVKIISEYKVNVTLLTQSMMNILMKFPECCNYDTSQVKYIMFGGSMIGGNTLIAITKMFPNAALINCFGMTEIGGLIFICPRDKNYFDSTGRFTVGKPNPGFYYKISPSVIEDQLMQHPAVRDVAIIPVPDEKGEVPAACIVLREGVSAKEEDFIQFITERLTTIYHLKGGVIFVDSLPRSSRGKLQRNVLKEKVLKVLHK